jgi:GNAT superfamily N-acetyltransferase
MSISITRASLEHLDILTPLFDGYRQFYLQPGNPQAARQYLKARIEDNSCVIFVAVDENGSGVGMVLLYQTWDSVDLETYWILHDLFVSPDSRTQGTGTALMQAAAAFGRSVGASRLDLGTGVANTTAQSLYESLGWQRDEEFYRYSLVLAGD